MEPQANEKGGEPVAPQAEEIKEILRGLDGLVMLSQWELTLAKDIREKMERLTESQGGDPQVDDAPPAQER
jgi:hypothetical protein